MILMLNFSNPYKYVCIQDGETKILKTNSFIDNYSGIADRCEEDIIGLFVCSNKLYFVKNNNVYDITDKNVECTNVINNGKRNFYLKIDSVLLYKSEYDFVCSDNDLINGTIEEEQDFMLYLSKILYSKETINTFIEGFSSKQCKTL